MFLSSFILRSIRIFSARVFRNFKHFRRLSFKIFTKFSNSYFLKLFLKIVLKIYSKIFLKLFVFYYFPGIYLKEPLITPIFSFCHTQTSYFTLTTIGRLLPPRGMRYGEGAISQRPEFEEDGNKVTQQQECE